MDSIQPYSSGLTNHQSFIPGTSSYTQKQETLVALTHDQTSDITIYTDEGDRVTLSSESSNFLYYSNNKSLRYEKFGTENTNYQNDEFLNQRSVTSQEEIFIEEHTSNFSITVEGDLSDQEIKDIQKVLKSIDKIMQHHLYGKDVPPGMLKSMDARGFDTIAGIEADYQYKDTMMLHQSLVKEAVSYDKAGVSEGTVSQIQEKEFDIENSIDQMTSIINDSGVSPSKLAVPVKNLFTNMLKILNNNKHENEARIHMANLFESALMNFINTDDSNIVKNT